MTVGDRGAQNIGQDLRPHARAPVRIYGEREPEGPAGTSCRRRTRTAIARVDEDMTEVVTKAQKRLDKAASQGVLHKNAAARRTSRLMKAANQAQQD